MPRPAAVDARLSAADILRSAPRERRNIFNPVTCAVIGIVAGLCGIVAILDVQPFASMSASERVSASIGHPASCRQVGVSAINSEPTAVYRCTIGAGAHTSVQCFGVAHEQVRQVTSSSRRLGC
jgi:hypothetical protein